VIPKPSLYTSWIVFQVLFDSSLFSSADFASLSAHWFPIFPEWDFTHVKMTALPFFHL
jgi:hypothetical protein